MKTYSFIVVIVFFLGSCMVRTEPQESVSSTLIAGTWQLVTGTIIEKGDTTITDYTKGRSFIKIINDTHFAFMLHDLAGGKDSTALFASGGGKYELVGNTYTEHLEYCNDRQWEGHDFAFTVTITGDTLIQHGKEEIEDAGISRLNIEKYVRAK